MKKIIISLLLLIFIGGCFNYNELNNYAIAQAIAIDYDHQYNVSLLISNAKSTDSKTSKNTVYSAKGKTIYEALQNLELISPNKIYLGHLSVAVISDKVAKKGLYASLSPLLTNNHSNKDFYIILAKDTKASKILKLPKPITEFPSQYIADNIKSTNKSQGKVSSITFNKLINQLISNNNPSINGFIIKDKYLQVDTLGYFKKDKLIGWASEEESNGINLINNHTNELYINLKCNDGNIGINTDNIQTKLHIDKKANTKIIVKGEATINEVSCSMDINNKKVIKKLHKRINNHITNYINQAINLSQNNQTDLFGIGKKYYQNYPKRYQHIDNWNKYFSHIKITSKVNITIKDNGSLKQSIERISHEKNY